VPIPATRDPQPFKESAMSRVQKATRVTIDFPKAAPLNKALRAAA
jgi:hypothetical protein